MDKINEKTKSYLKYVINSAQSKIELVEKTREIVLELDRLNVEANYVNEKQGKIILSIGKYNLVIQRSKDKFIYLLFDFETKQKIVSTFDVNEFKKSLIKIKS